MKSFYGNITNILKNEMFTKIKKKIWIIDQNVWLLWKNELSNFISDKYIIIPGNEENKQIDN